uniref:Phlebovirus glycoprotein G2 fusion domain-containing protein n=1 Tax=Parascaris equorum TaxID=6256 RepID=A0A914RTJ5_PAREQ
LAHNASVGGFCHLPSLPPFSRYSFLRSRCRITFKKIHRTHLIVERPTVNAYICVEARVTKKYEEIVANILFFDELDGGHKDSSQRHVLRIRRDSKKLYEKILSRYDGLLAAYSMCTCPTNDTCTSLHGDLNGTICLCFFNKKNGHPFLVAQISHFPYHDAVSLSESEMVGTQPRYSKTPSLNILKTYSRPAEPPRIIKEQEQKEKAFGLKGMSDPIAIKAKASENLIFAVNNLNDTDKSSISYSKQEFITKCSFNGRQCSVETDFSSYIDPSFGNCFTFNFNSTENMTSERAGPSYEITLLKKWPFKVKKER